MNINSRKLVLTVIAIILLSLPLSVLLTAQSSTHKATVAWNYTQGTDPAIGFNVFRSLSASGPFTQQNPTTLSITTLSYVDTTVSAGTTYFYTVDAVDAAGNHSAQTLPISGVIPGNPTLPTGVTVVTQ